MSLFYTTQEVYTKFGTVSLAVDEETDTLLKYDVVDLSHPIDAALLDNIQKDGMMLYEKI